MSVPTRSRSSPLGGEAVAEGSGARVGEETADFGQVDLVFEEIAGGGFLEEDVVGHGGPEEVGEPGG